MGIKILSVNNPSELGEALAKIFSLEYKKQSKVEEKENTNGENNKNTESSQDSIKKHTDKILQNLINELAEGSKSEMNRRLEELKPYMQAEINKFTCTIQENCPGCIIKKYLKGKMDVRDVLHIIGQNTLNNRIQGLDRLQAMYTLLYGEHYEPEIGKHDHE